MERTYDNKHFLRNYPLAWGGGEGVLEELWFEQMEGGVISSFQKQKET
jgi:hypothetical protein